jgi:hypothetical protein
MKSQTQALYMFAVHGGVELLILSIKDNLFIMACFNEANNGVPISSNLDLKDVVPLNIPFSLYLEIANTNYFIN